MASLEIYAWACKVARKAYYTATRLHGYTATRLHGYTATRFYLDCVNLARAFLAVFRVSSLYLCMLACVGLCGLVCLSVYSHVVPCNHMTAARTRELCELT